jgi:hypothetical protein
LVSVSVEAVLADEAVGEDKGRHRADRLPDQIASSKLAAPDAPTSPLHSPIQSLDSRPLAVLIVAESEVQRPTIPPNTTGPKKSDL